MTLPAAAPGTGPQARLPRHMGRYAPRVVPSAAPPPRRGASIVHEAAAAYARALEMATNAAERRFLEERLREVGAADDDGKK